MKLPVKLEKALILFGESVHPSEKTWSMQMMSTYIHIYVSNITKCYYGLFINSF